MKKIALQRYILIFSAVTILSSCGWVNDFASNWNLEEEKYTGIEVKDWSSERAPAPGQELSSSNIPVLPKREAISVPDNIVNASHQGNFINTQPKGLSDNLLLAGNSGNVEERLARLEETVMNMRTDMDRLVPVLSKLAQAERELRAVLNNVGSGNKEVVLEPVSVKAKVNSSANSYNNVEPSSGRRDAYGMVDVEENTEPVEVAYMMAGIEPTAGSKKQKQEVVNNIRFGEHSEKTRIVLDVSGKINYKTDLDNNEGLLIINLPNVKWDNDKEKIIKDSPLIYSYDVQKTDKGSRLIFDLKKKAKIKMSSLFPPLKDGSKGYRVVIDIGDV